MSNERSEYSLTKEKAVKIAASIETYWRMKGHRNVNCRVELVPDRPDRHYQVRSNLVQGLPPK